MYPVMKSASRWNGYIFCGVLVLMMVYSIPKLLSFSKDEQEPLSLFLSGDLSRKFEGTFDQQFPVRDASISFWAGLKYLAFGEGESGVLIGREGWLFSNEELLLPNRTEDVVADHVAKVSEYIDALQAKGKKVIVVPVPMKVTVYPEYYASELSPEYYSVNENFLRGLNREGIPHVNLYSEYINHKSVDDKLLYLKTDTHWSAHGAKIAAQVVAQQYPELVMSREYRTQNGGRDQYQGDLTNFLLAPGPLLGDLKAPETIDVYETSAVIDESSASALFGETSDSLDLVGTSYSDIEQWNFRGFLQQDLARNVDSYSLKEKGPYAAMDEYLASGVDQSTSEVVIWELPMRVLLKTDHRKATWQQTLQSQF
ncbi:hypothetical protein [Gilvimarinus sp. DA14]|uniref:alginate O-acetyltransferase AlgX-related protein n=1 Tax=Gilvimarinus sp. DA14 TaxID=2956798 RepID=UPI0020B6ABBD|nr:hypothetical protein [Gilvimarinus sp. DA14]UTF59857.1 hypothetical protein NHM04_15505 [Gilvimarinus sp. DA14]